MIVGTAGHIDHGKTTLIRALTGVDSDRLPEEKKRGITIDLGYAFLDSGAERIGFVDVPGHERLVRTMLAGATGIDFALLLVAADDGVMPQTREHLAIIAMLGLKRGAVLVTKIDRTDPSRVRAVCAEAKALLFGTPLADAPVLAVSAKTGEGIANLIELLHAAASQAVLNVQEGVGFRLAIDRAFTLPGVGTVVTGTVHAGSVAVGDELAIVPSPTATTVRVRSLHAQARLAQRAQIGQRCAVALAGVTKDQVARGQWLVSPAVAVCTDRVDASVTVWRDETSAMRSGTSVQVHIGAAMVPATVVLLDFDSLLPEHNGRVQLVLRRNIGAWIGDHIVLRDETARRTVAGGLVLDPMASARYRRTPRRLSELDALALSTAAQRHQALLRIAQYGIDLRKLRTVEGLLIDPFDPAANDAVIVRDKHAEHALDPVHAAAAEERALATLAAYHESRPNEVGPDAARFRRLAVPRLSQPLWRALLERLRSAGKVTVRGAFVQLPTHCAHLSQQEEHIAQLLMPILLGAEFDGVWVRALAREAEQPESLVRLTVASLCRRGELHQVVSDLIYPASTITTLARVVRRIAVDNAGQVTAAAFRDATQLGRKRAVQILEHFDRIGVLRRVGDVHKLRTDSVLSS